MAATDQALAVLAANRSRWVEHLAAFVSIPSVSPDPRRRDDVHGAARWLRDRLRAIGMPTARLLESPGSPLVWARTSHRAHRPTVLMYGHYDVVSAGPSLHWRTQPFAPERRGRFLYGRGASDDKGPLLAQLAALEAWLTSAGRAPVNVVCLYDGEEEVGSPHLLGLLRDRARHVPSADAVLVSDTRMLAPGRPALIVGLRGGLGVEVELRGPPRELHSGAFGGVIRNPAHALAELVASLHDRSGRVTIEGFYDDVRAARRAPLGGGAERLIAAQIAEQAGRRALFGEPGYSTYERGTIRPALDVNGLFSGHSGPGGKGIIPSRAVAKLSFRLVPDQDPARVAAQLERHLEHHAPAGVGVRAVFSKPSRPVTVDPGSAAVRAAGAALAAGFGTPPVLLRSGGSIPVVEALAARVGPPVLMGFARADDGMHGPNERVDLSALAAGSRSVVRFLELLARR